MNANMFLRCMVRVRSEPQTIRHWFYRNWSVSVTRGDVYSVYSMQFKHPHTCTCIQYTVYIYAHIYCILVQVGVDWIYVKTHFMSASSFTDYLSVLCQRTATISVLISSTCITNMANVSKGFPLLVRFLSASASCMEMLRLISRGCPFQRGQQTRHQKGQRYLNNIKDLRGLSSACLYPPKKTSLFEGKTVCRPVTLICQCCLSCLTLALTDSWHRYCFSFADWHEIYWQRVPRRKQGGIVSKVGAMGI